MILFADCDDKSQLYDFTTHKCVPQCPCGYAPFRKHHTSYCEPGTLLCTAINVCYIKPCKYNKLQFSAVIKMYNYMLK